MKTRRKPGRCCCAGVCVVFSDNFNRADYTFPNQVTDATGNWLAGKYSNPGSWEIFSNQLQIVCTNATSAYPDFPANPHIQTQLVLPTDFIADLSFILPTVSGGQEAKFYLLAEFDSSTTGYGGYAVEVAAGSDCGWIRLRQRSGSSWIDLPWQVPVPGLVPDQKHRVTLCYDPQTQILSTHVTLNDGSVHSHHAFNADIDNRADRVRYHIVPNAAVDGTYTFDDFKIVEIHQLGAGYGYGYDYGYGYGDNGCPCCGPHDCQTVTLTFAGEPLDCRLEVDSGTATLEDGALKLTDGGITYLGSWSGIDPDCLPDETASAVAIFSTPDYGTSLTITIGDTSVTLTMPSEEGGDGTLVAGNGDPVTVSGLATDSAITLSACLYPGTIIGAVGGAAFAEGTVASGAALSPVSFTSAGEVDITSLSISHNSLSEDCDVCFGGGMEQPNDCDWCGGETIPSAFSVGINMDVGDLEFGSDPCHPGVCDLINGMTWILRYERGCAFASPGVFRLETTGLAPDCSRELLPGCNTNPGSPDVCVGVTFSAAIDGSELVLTGTVQVTGDFFTEISTFVGRVAFVDDSPPDCHDLFSGGATLTFDHTYKNGAILDRNLCGGSTGTFSISGL